MFYYFCTLGLMLVAAPLAVSAEGPTDRQIEAAIHSSYTFHTILRDRVTARSSGGRLILTGSVAEDEDRSLAIDTAVSIRGVVNIDSRMEIEAVPARDSDVRIARHLLRRLQAQAGISVSALALVVTDGVVTLCGTTPELEQSQRIQSLATEAPGVRAVRNELVVAPGLAPAFPDNEPMDDASLTAQVNLALRSNAGTADLR